MGLRRLLAARAIKPLSHVYSQGACASSVAMSKMEPDSKPVNELYSTMEDKLKARAGSAQRPGGLLTLWRPRSSASA